MASGRQVGQPAYVHALGKGFAALATALAHAGVNCNIAPRALMMAKEHLIETYGPVRYTIGSGCSGGSLVPQQVANAYPGIYDGLAVTCSFPDFWSGATIAWVVDQTLLNHYFTAEHTTPGTVWTPAQMQAVLGQPFVDNAVTDVLYNYGFNFFDPTVLCPGITQEQVYDPETNPGGTRCNSADWAPNILGSRPESVWTEQEREIQRGFVGLPISNLGVQYGLEALAAGEISPAQFVDMNVKVGSFDIDYHWTPARTQADLDTLRNVYRSGSINDATRLSTVPIINGVPPADPASENHPSHNAYVTRARLEREGGGAGSYVIWEGPTPLYSDTAFYRTSLDAIDRWLAAIAQDDSGRPLAERVVANRPEDIRDACYDGNGNPSATASAPSCSATAQRGTWPAHRSRTTSRRVRCSRSAVTATRSSSATRSGRSSRRRSPRACATTHILAWPRSRRSRGRPTRTCRAR